MAKTTKRARLQGVVGQRWRNDNPFHQIGTNPFLAVLKGPRGDVWKAVMHYDASGYLLQPSLDGDMMLPQSTKLEAWQPLPAYTPNASNERQL